MTGRPARNPSAQTDHDGWKMAGERYESFVVRVVVGTDGRIARGQVTHVATGERLHFTHPEHVPDLIRRLALAHAAKRESET